MTVDEVVALVKSYVEENGLWMRDAARFLLPYVRGEINGEDMAEFEEKLRALVAEDAKAGAVDD